MSLTTGHGAFPPAITVIQNTHSQLPSATHAPVPPAVVPNPECNSAVSNLARTASQCTGSNAAAPFASLSDTTVSKTYTLNNNEILLNPGKGWILYGTNATQEVKDITSICYDRTAWANVEKSPGVIDFWFVRNLIRDCPNQQVAFGFYPICANCTGESAPEWLFSELGAQFTMYNGKKVPVWSDPIYLQRQKMFVEAMAAIYNGDPRIAYIDALSYGHWGEWHTGGLGDDSLPLNSATKKKVVDMWSVFTETTIMIPNNNNNDVNGTVGSGPQIQAQYGSDKYGFGVRRDSSEVQHYGSAYSRGKEIAVSEWYRNYPDNMLKPSYLNTTFNPSVDIPKYMKASRYSYDNLNLWGVDQAQQFYNDHTALVKEWANKMGYWFKLVNSTYSANYLASGELTIVVRNDGVAPIFVNKKRAFAVVALLDASGNAIETSRLNNIVPFSWKSEQTFTQSDTFQFSGNAPADSRLAFGVFSNENLAHPDIKFGNANRLPNNWIVLST
jgi:hypothetical protein